MNFMKSIAIGIAVLMLTQTASAEVLKASGVRTANIWVECLNDTIVLDWKFNRVVAVNETKNTWMFTRNVRQSGNAVDSYGNTWKFRGHFQSTEHVDLTADLFTTNFHLLSHDVMVGEPGGPGNLLFRTMWRITYDNGVPTLDLRETTVSCLP